MCGIAGWIDYNENIENEDKIMDRVSQTLARRGPDAFGAYKCKTAYLVHRRLIVVDPQNGIQPMVKKHGESEYALVYNGELYNTEDIRKELLEHGYSFAGHSDTEVLLAAYIEWGADCVDKLNGIYAFAVYESQSKSLFLARDRIGVKPLFYYKYDGGIIFGSEIKTLLAHPYVKPNVTKHGLADVLMLGPGRTPGGCAFKNIRELKPGWCAALTKNSFNEKRYWRIYASEHTDNLQQTIEKTRCLITDAIERQLVSDVPLCTFLSGGLDSSIISAVAAEKYKQQGMQLSTYSVDYTDNDKYFKSSYFQPNSDKAYIDIMTNHCGTKHNSYVIETGELVNALYDAVKARDLPGMSDVDSSLLLFCNEVKKNFTVAVSGECADEIFGGYPWYHNKEILFAEGFPWAQSTNMRRALFYDNLFDFDANEYVLSRYNATLADTDLEPNGDKLENRMKEMFMLNFSWFMQTLLDRKDRMSMYCGLEVRVPFCDHRIVEYAYNIPWQYKALDGREKGLVRKAVADLLPPEIAERKKSPYPKTHNPAYQSAVKSELKAVAQNPQSPKLKIMSTQTIQNLFDTDCASFEKHMVRAVNDIGANICLSFADKLLAGGIQG